MRKSVAHKRNKHKVHCEMEGAKPAHRDKEKGPTKTRTFSVQTRASYALSAPSFCVFRPLITTIRLVLLLTKSARAACPCWPPIIESFLLLSSTARMLVANVASKLSNPSQSFFT